MTKRISPQKMIKEDLSGWMGCNIFKVCKGLNCVHNTLIDFSHLQITEWKNSDKLLRRKGFIIFATDLNFMNKEKKEVFASHFIIETFTVWTLSIQKLVKMVIKVKGMMLTEETEI